MALAYPHFLSLVPIKIELLFNETVLSLGTAFFFEISDDLFLVSNWHNFSGKNPFTGKLLSDTAGIPNKVKCRLLLNKELTEWGDCIFDLSNKDNSTLWFQHPEHGKAIDIAVLPVKLPKKFKRIAINQYKFTDMHVEVSQDVFILGFPRGISGRKELPIWKRGSIASEPGGKYPRILIDTATREGMSGSPVIMKYRGVYLTNGHNGPSDDDWFGEGELFLGIYSGRLGEDEFKAQLGIVWKKEAIEEIINGKVSFKS